MLLNHIPVNIANRQGRRPNGCRSKCSGNGSLGYLHALNDARPRAAVHFEGPIRSRRQPTTQMTIVELKNSVGKGRAGPYVSRKRAIPEFNELPVMAKRLKP